MTSILEPDCAGMSVPATSIGFGLATLTGQESIVRVEATGPPVGAGIGEGTGAGGTGVGDGSSGTLRGASNDAAETRILPVRWPNLREDETYVAPSSASVFRSSLIQVGRNG